MRILFIKAVKPSDDSDNERMPLPEKMKLILAEHVRAATTGESRERAERALSQFQEQPPAT